MSFCWWKFNIYRPNFLPIFDSPFYRTLTRLYAIFFIFICLNYQAQVNAYAKITAISGNVLTLNNVNQSFDNFLPGEQVIIIQMQGASIGSNTTNASSFGNLSSLNSAGLYEVATIANVNGAVSSMTLNTALSNTYNTAGSLQLVSFPKLGTSYSTTAVINCVAWDGNVGGVVAFYVSGNINLFHSITANGLGFRGGKKSGLDGSSCDDNTFRTSSGNAKYANKGEGIYLTTSNQKAGRGKAVNGGGGGNVHNGGGGGGSNFTYGGAGYDGWPGAGCGSLVSAGGLGGIAISSSVSRVFMGGGGGGGQENDGQASNGANGGGVILIKADSIIVSGACSAISISANGDAALASGQDGAGGGGAGGTIVLNIKGLRVKNGCPLTIAADGGAGADVNHWDTHGSGGGGGQGAIYLNTSTSFTNVAVGTNFGTGGHSSDDPLSPTAGSGGGPANAGVFAGAFSGSPLPIELISFSAIESEPNVINLEWFTGSEKNSKVFEVYHASSSTDWVKIAEVGASGNSSLIKKYLAKHLEPKDGINYYQLKEIDMDGKFTYSPITYVDIESNKKEVKVFPNPSNGDLYLQSDQDLSDEHISVTNAYGQVVNFNLTQENSGLFRIQLEKPQTGIYYLISQNIREKLIIK